MAKYNLVVKYVDDVKYNILWNKMFIQIFSQVDLKIKEN